MNKTHHYSAHLRIYDNPIFSFLLDVDVIIATIYP